VAEIKPLKFGFDGAAPVSIDEMATGDTLPKAALPTLTQDDVGDGTTYKQYSATEKSKLSGIEAAADVTDAVNVGTAIHSVDEKTTPVDTDTMPLIDSAASNALKKVTWANVKATLKAYFDTLYTLANLGGIAHSLATAANDFLVASGSGTFVKKTLAETKTILDLGTIASQASNNVSITGGSITGITDLAIADGGTGASTASGAFTALKQDATTSATGVVELATTAEDVAGTSSAVVTTPVGMAAKVATDVNPKAFAQGVAMTAAASGSNGIAVADNNNIDFGTGNFTLVWKGSLPDWKTAAEKYLMYKYQAATDRWRIIVDENNKVAAYFRVGDAVVIYKISNAVTLTDNTEHEIVISVTRETASASGTVDFYCDGISIGSSTITAAATVSLSNSSALYISGDSTRRDASINKFVATFNRALTAAEVLDLYRNGINYADKWGSQTPLSASTLQTLAALPYTTLDGTSPTGFHAVSNGSTTMVVGTPDEVAFIAGKRYKISWDIILTSGTAPRNIIRQGAVSGTVYSIITNAVTTTSVEYTATVSENVSIYFDSQSVACEYTVSSFKVVAIGAVLALEPEGIQPAPGQWLDASTNKLHAMQPASGSSLIRSKRDFEFRSTNTWTASAAAQYIGGVNQNCVTTKHLITEIISRTTVTTDVENIEIGDGSDADRYVAEVTPTAAPLVHTLTNRINDGTNLKLVVTPAAEATMTIEFIIRGIILE
jgi:hypothetical protein